MHQAAMRAQVSMLLSLDRATISQRLRLLEIVLALAALTLVAVTWRLWIPHRHVPQVPLFYAASRLPDWLEWASLFGLIASLATVVFASSVRIRSAALVLFALSVTLLVVSDQLRLQPWAYQFVIVALVLALASDSDALRWLRLFIASFYVYSAITKLDYSFLHTLGQQFLAALGDIAGVSIDGWSGQTRVAAALVFPVSELVIGLALLVPRLRRAAVVGAIALHGLLLLILGPWGLHHKPGVLLWNVYFIVQDILVFWPAKTSESPVAVAAPPERPDNPSRTAAGVIALAAILLPILGPTTWFDMWPSWGLYASNAERTLLLIHRQAIDQLPIELQAYSESGDASLEPWVSLRFDRWALESLGAPIYPQNRVQLGVAAAVIDRYQLANRARVVRLSLANRWTGERTSTVTPGGAQTLAAMNEYFFNARPRPESYSP